MPELPEMETYRNLLEDRIINKVITNVQVEREKSINLPVQHFIQEVLGKRIVAITRRAKHLLFHLENQNILLVHLMLGGWMYYGNEQDKPNRTVQVQLSFHEQHLYFIGLRLGYLHFLTPEEANAKLKDHGPEPLEHAFDLPFFLNISSKKRGKIKLALVDQKFISGIGNCYSDEICFWAGIHPMREVPSLHLQEKERLYHAIKEVLQEAIQYGGYMEEPLYLGDRLTGGYNPRCKVYDREGEPCFRCGTSIIKETISSRKTFFCPNCQPFA